MPDIALTPDEQLQLLSLLSKVEPGFYPIELFWEFARLMTVSTIEFVPLRRNADRFEVLLLPRADDDKFWPGKTHIPGCVVRPTDSQEDVFDRIAHDELQGVALGRPEHVLTQVRRTNRGNEQVQVYCVEVISEAEVGSFYDVDDLPTNLLEVYPSLIQKAVESFAAV